MKPDHFLRAMAAIILANTSENGFVIGIFVVVALICLVQHVLQQAAHFFDT